MNIFGAIKKCLNSNLNVPLNEQIEEKLRCVEYIYGVEPDEEGAEKVELFTGNKGGNGNGSSYITLLKYMVRRSGSVKIKMRLYGFSWTNYPLKISFNDVIYTCPQNPNGAEYTATVLVPVKAGEELIVSVYCSQGNPYQLRELTAYFKYADISKDGPFINTYGL